MIVLTKHHAEMLKSHAEREAPKEACGIIGGKRNNKKLVKAVYECRNVSSSPLTNYTIDPKQLLQVVNEIEDSGLEVIGFYHSHPMGLNCPSAIDHGKAAWSGCSYLIISNSDISSWIWDDGKKRFVEEEVVYD